MRDNFNSKDIVKLAERAGYICSNPDCQTITVGPSEANATLSAKIGKAAHIHAAASGGPRYKKEQSPEQRSNIENGIWLCATCSDLIDKNKGVDYPSNVLVSWKQDHEKMISQLLRSGSSPLSLIRKHTKEGVVAQQVLEILDTKGVFFMDSVYERNQYIILSLKEIRENLTDILHSIDIESPIYNKVRLIIDYCRKYMNEMQSQDDFELMSSHLLVMRKAVGIILKSLCDQYSIQPPPNLIRIMPR